MFFIDKALTPITMVIVGIYSLSQMGADVVPAAIKEAVRPNAVMRRMHRLFLVAALFEKGGKFLCP